jgi:hypothetical protein
MSVPLLQLRRRHVDSLTAPKRKSKDAVSGWSHRPGIFASDSAKVLADGAGFPGKPLARWR